MWNKIASFVLRYSFALAALIILSTVFFSVCASKVKMEYDFAQIIPPNEQIVKDFDFFKTQFSNDANTLVAGFTRDTVFNKTLLNNLYKLCNNLKKIEGVTGVLGIPTAVHLKKNKTEKKFEVEPLMTRLLKNQAEADSLKNTFKSWKFYENKIFNDSLKATLIGVTIDINVLSSKSRVDKVEEIFSEIDGFAKKNDLQISYSGFPYLRNYRVTTMRKEVQLFLVLSAIVVAIVLFLLYRSFWGIVLPVSIVSIGVIWSIGMIWLFGYKIDLLLGITPTLIVIIGIPNCVYFFNKYQLEYSKIQQKKEALHNTIMQIGNVTFYANLTTAIGFAVFAITKSKMLQQFGLIAGLSVLATYFISIIMLPAVLKLLPPIKLKRNNRERAGVVAKAIEGLKFITANGSKWVWLTTALIIVVALLGLINLKSQGYIFDDIPKKTKSYSDLLFFEDNFTGVIPFEIIMDTKKKGKVTKLSTLKIIDEIQQKISVDEAITKPLSIVEGLKMASQAYYEGNPKRYSLPTSGTEKNLVFNYLSKTQNSDVAGNLVNRFIDKDQQLARISFQMKDIGSAQFEKKMQGIEKIVNESIGEKPFDVIYTGTTMMVLKSYQFLVDGLFKSLVFAFLIIAIIMGILFRSFKMLLAAIIPNIIPLLITSAVMGYFNIYLKPATVLIFSIAFGISVDFTIHFLAKYKQALVLNNNNVKQTIFTTLNETGFSMIYTAIILLFGFLVFLVSSFEGTLYLGLLSSITIVVALLSNLILLPAIILVLNK